jgi:hypothetical protein
VKPIKAGKGPIPASEGAKGIRQKEVLAFLASEDDWWLVDSRGCKAPDSCHTSMRKAIHSLGVESKAYSLIKDRQVYLVKGEPDYGDRRRRR